MFSALNRLPESMPLAEKQQVVEAVMKALSLDELQNSVIGDENVRGISGGQRKRVNIGIEMVAAPLVLFLDEPTSGLDSSSSVETIGALQSLLPYSLTIAAVIHQPREEIFNMFDRVILLAKGGKTVYSGRRDLMVPYFEQLGYDFGRSNPADLVLDIVSGTLKPEDGSSPDLVQLWIEYSAQRRSMHRMPSVDNQEDLDALKEQRAGGGSAEKDKAEAGKKAPSPDVAFFILTLLACAAGIAVGAALIGAGIGRNTPMERGWLWITVPFCSIVIALFLGIFLFTVICKALSKLEAENTFHFAFSSLTGPLGVGSAVVFGRNDAAVLYAGTGFGVFCMIVFLCLATWDYLQPDYPSAFNYSEDIGAAFMFFVCVVFGFCLMMACIWRIRRKAQPRTSGASFVGQLGYQIVRCFSEVISQPAGLLLDWGLPLIAGLFLGLTTVGKVWEPPVIEEVSASNCQIFLLLLYSSYFFPHRLASTVPTLTVFQSCADS